ncbi:MAG: winged helix-turn-helix transcriptional regulator [Deltaproteobacteria bacterium]|nr:winged helix-turn-helix transcriptional regulator [Deltaproteobacteria bacterium]
MIDTKTILSEEDVCRIRVVHMDRVRLAHDEAISDQELDRLSSMYKVLGDPTRLKIVMALKDVEMCVCDLSAFLGVSESAVSHQLRRLRDLALVKKRRDGQVIYYTLDDRHIADLLSIALDHVRE